MLLWDDTCMQYLLELHGSDLKTNLLLLISFSECQLCSFFLVLGFFFSFFLPFFFPFLCVCELFLSRNYLKQPVFLIRCNTQTCQRMLTTFYFLEVKHKGLQDLLEIIASHKRNFFCLKCSYGILLH